MDSGWGWDRPLESRRGLGAQPIQVKTANGIVFALVFALAFALVTIIPLETLLRRFDLVNDALQRDERAGPARLRQVVQEHRSLRVHVFQCRAR